MKQLLSLIFAVLLSAGAAAQEMAPDVLVKSVTEDVLAAVRQDKDIQNGNTQKTIDLVETKVLPYFNFRRMTSLAVGRDWNKATPQQKDLLTRQFQELLVRTYSNALSAYRDQVVRYRPFKMNPGDTDVLVRTEVIQPGARPIQLDYSLEKSDKGWKVYDVVVSGVSLVTNYRESFAQEIRNGGIDGLIHSLEAKNKSLVAGKAA
ncbi:MAG: ABC transporter substrate-binding protein [Azovibrio sp.]|uniref:MlaC/ttg2D family ABC transporter substrate-binding protein n=1 Tax=Azovibrio sp. TaxID=1872673 RepID=UPI003C796A3D